MTPRFPHCIMQVLALATNVLPVSRTYEDCLVHFRTFLMAAAAAGRKPALPYVDCSSPWIGAGGSCRGHTPPCDIYACQ